MIARTPVNTIGGSRMLTKPAPSAAIVMLSAVEAVCPIASICAMRRNPRAARHNVCGPNSMRSATGRSAITKPAITRPGCS